MEDDVAHRDSRSEGMFCRVAGSGLDSGSGLGFRILSLEKNRHEIDRLQWDQTAVRLK